MNVLLAPRQHVEGYRFVLVGAVGFATDALVLTLLLRSGQSILFSRACSFGCASLLTWWLHRVFTFAGRSSAAQAKGDQYARYVVVQLLGALANLAVFYALARAAPALLAWPIVLLAIGAVAGLFVNYLGSSRWAFRTRRDHE